MDSNFDKTTEYQCKKDYYQKCSFILEIDDDAAFSIRLRLFSQELLQSVRKSIAKGPFLVGSQQLLWIYVEAR